MFWINFSNLVEDVMLKNREASQSSRFQYTNGQPQQQKYSQILQLVGRLGLIQHVQDSTYSSGHTLDLIITKLQKTPIYGLSNSESLKSDYHCISFNLDTIKPKFLHKKITCRKMKDIYISDSFQKDLAAAIDNFDLTVGSVSEIVDKYNKILESTDKHAHLKNHMVAAHNLHVMMMIFKKQEKNKMKGRK